MRILRDLLAIFGSICAGWVVWWWQHMSDRGLIPGLIVTLISLGITIQSIRSGQGRDAKTQREMDKVRTRNTYLEVAIRQMGGDDVSDDPS